MRTVPQSQVSCVLRAAVLASLLVPAASSAAQDVATPTLVIRRVNVLPMDRDTLLVDRDVVIAGRRIVAIVPASRTAPGGVPTLDGAGLFLIPGLWDAHRRHCSSAAGTSASSTRTAPLG